MRFRILTGTLLAVWSVAAVHALEGQAPASVAEGAYTKEQAKRGEKVYADTCASCHGANLLGGEMAPALAGPDFLAGWAGKQTLNDLYLKVHEEMPQDNPGTLTPAQAADAVAFMLATNKYPAGKVELTSDKGVLKAIKIDAPK